MSISRSISSSISTASISRGISSEAGEAAGPPQPAVATPSITSPADDAVDIGETPTLTSSAFAVTNEGVDTHASSDWQIASDAGFSTIVVQSLDDTTNKTSWTVPSGNLDPDTEYFARVRHTGTTYGDSGWSAVVSFTTAEAFGPTFADFLALGPVAFYVAEQSPGTINTNGTGAVAGIGDPVGRIPDLSGNGNDLVAGDQGAASDTARAVLASGSNAAGWLFNGSSNFYSPTTSIPITANMTVLRAVAGGLNDDIRLGFFGSSTTPAETFLFSNTDLYANLGSAEVSKTGGPYNNPLLLVNSRTETLQTVRVNGVQEISSTAFNQAEGLFTRFGRRFSSFTEGVVLASAVFDRTLTGADLALAEEYLARLNGVTLP